MGSPQLKWEQSLRTSQQFGVSYNLIVLDQLVVYNQYIFTTEELIEL